MNIQQDLDDYINGLHKKIDHLENVIKSYKHEVRMLRADYAHLKQERDILLEDLQNNSVQ